MSQFFRTFAVEMNKIRRIIMCMGLCVAMATYGQDVRVEQVMEDIFNQLSEDGDLSYEDIEEELLSIADNPMDLNTVTQEELSRLMFLSDEQIDAILMYQYEHGFKEIYELQLIDCLKDYEIRNLLPFVRVDSLEVQGFRSSGGKKMYFREVFHYAKHEMTLRMDARNIEDFEGDPMYGKLRYRFNYRNRVQAGVSVLRRQGDEAIRQEGDRWDYGGYIQLKDIGPMKTIVAGNYQANFGYGLVVGTPFKRGKSAYIQSTATTDEGLKKFSSVGDSYKYFHGVGATARVKWADLSAFYSLRKGKEDAWNHVVGANATARWKKLKVGVTGVETFEVKCTPKIGRFFGDPAGERREARGAMGANVRYNWGKVDVWGEVAASHAEQWGWGTIMGLRVNPISDLNLLAIYRYYSPEYENVYANSLSSKTRVSDEHGGYLGVEYNRLINWQLSLFGDVWKEGYETMAQADFVPQKNYKMHMRLRAKRKNEIDTYSTRWNGMWELGQWRLKTQIDANMVYAKEKWNYGFSIFQDVEYRFARVPIVLQFRAQAFDAREWNNRVYMYENDVLYAYAIPFVYGLGGRFWLNARYKINDTFALYLRVSETVYQGAWAAAHDKQNTRTDIHALLRVKL